MSNEKGFDKNFMYFTVDRVIPFPIILEKAGFENYQYDMNVYCPFHPNDDTPAAKIFNDTDGDRLYCWAEREMYRPSDVIKEDLMKIRIQKVFHNIWNKLSESEKDRLKEEYGQPQEFFTEEFEEVIEKMESFKRGDIDLNGYLKLMLEAVDEL